MKPQLKTLIGACASVMILAGCSGNKDGREAASSDNDSREASATAEIRGQWYIENIVFNDSDYVRPDEAAPGSSQYIIFEDSTYSIMTNCNSITGTFTLKGDSITLSDGPMTEIACDNMETEEALRRILPDISTVDVQNDSVIRLNGASPAECILLRKTTTEIK